MIKVNLYKTDIQDLISYQTVANLQNMNLSYLLIGHYIIFLKSDQWAMGIYKRMYLNLKQENLLAPEPIMFSFTVTRYLLIIICLSDQSML